VKEKESNIFVLKPHYFTDNVQQVQGTLISNFEDNNVCILKSISVHLPPPPQRKWLRNQTVYVLLHFSY